MKHRTSIYLLISILFLALPLKVMAQTLQEYINKVDQYRTELNNANAAINKTDKEIQATQNEISAIKTEMVNISNEIISLNTQIEESNQKIKVKSLEIKNVFQYYQMTNGENTYLEYIFGATSITDLIYRLSVVEQVTDYNKKVEQELKNLIEENKKTQAQLAVKTKELEAKKVTLSTKISELQGSKQSLVNGAASSQDQLSIYEQIVKSYESQGCKPSDQIGIDCAKNNTAVGWYRPTEIGAISQTVGWTSYNLDGFHYGTDIYSYRQTGERVYAIASGKISSIYRDIYGAKIVVVYHTDINGTSWTSLYCHLSSYNPSIYVGMPVTQNTYLGYMGATGYAFGVHLHIEAIDCRLFDPTDSRCSTWSRYTSYIKQRYNGGFYGAKTLINLPSSWSSR